MLPTAPVADAPVASTGRPRTTPLDLSGAHFTRTTYERTAPIRQLRALLTRLSVQRLPVEEGEEEEEGVWQGVYETRVDLCVTPDEWDRRRCICVEERPVGCFGFVGVALWDGLAEVFGDALRLFGIASVVRSERESERLLWERKLAQLW